MVECYDLVWRQGIQIPLLPYQLSRPDLMSGLQQKACLIEAACQLLSRLAAGFVVSITARKLYNLSDNYGLVDQNFGDTKHTVGVPAVDVGLFPKRLGKNLLGFFMVTCCIPVLPAQCASQIRSAASASVSIPWNSCPARIQCTPGER